MTEQIRAQISALVDDELHFHEWDLLAKRLRNDSTLRNVWEHYHLIGSAMQDSLAPCDTYDFTSRVMVELERENLPRQFESRRRRTAGLAAVAVSVAALAAIGLTGHYASPETGRVDKLAAVSSVTAAEDQAVHWNRRPMAVQHQLNNLLINHTDYVSGLRRQTMLPYLHVAAYDTPLENSQSRSPVMHTVADDSPH